MVFTVATVASGGQPAPPRSAAPPVFLGDVVSVVTGDARARDALDGAIAMWRACPQFARGFPRIAAVPRIARADLVEGERHGRMVTVVVERGFGRADVCGTFQGMSIVLHRGTLDLRGRPRFCGAVAANLAHEIGHVLGLDDDPGFHADVGPTGVMTSTTAAIAGPPRSVTPRECVAVDRRWMTSLELRQAHALGIAKSQQELGKPLSELAEEWHHHAYATEPAGDAYRGAWPRVGVAELSSEDRN
jgi:hypothetical protein